MYYETHRPSLPGTSPQMAAFDQLVAAIRDKVDAAVVAPGSVNEGFLETAEQYWNVDSLEQAMFQRIISDEEIRRLPLDQQLQIWNASVDGSIAQLLNGIPHQPSWKVLEIGCGIGRLIKPLREKFAEVDGVDIADNMIRFGELYLADGKGKGRLAKNSGSDLTGFDDVHYDYVYSTIVFQHIRSLSVVQRYLREIHRVLKPGGFFRLQVHDTSSPNCGAFDGEANPRLQYEMFGNAYTPDQLRRLLAEHGYQVQDLTHSTPWIWATARRPGRSQ